MASAERFLELLQTRLATLSERVVIFWHVVETGSRADFAAALAAQCKPLPLFPLIPQEGALFLDPNVFISDLIRLVEASRATFEPATSGYHDSQVILVILSRRPLAIPPTPSPAVLPEWFPSWGGREIPVWIEDLTRDAYVASLNSPEMSLADLAQRLYALDRHLSETVKRVKPPRPQAFDSLFTGIGLDIASGALLGDWERNLDSVSDPRSYRLSLGKQPGSLLAALVRLAAVTTPDQLYSRGEILGHVLGLPGGAPDPTSLPAILYRATSVKGTLNVGQTLLVTTFGAYQLMNAAAHAAAYPRFPLALLVSVSRDIRRTLDVLTGLRLSLPES